MKFFLACSDIFCGSNEFCLQNNPAWNAVCRCGHGFRRNRNGVCRARPRIFRMRFRFTLSFNVTFNDFSLSLTISFVSRLKFQLHRALRLSTAAEIDIIGFSQGSTIADFDVLLPTNATETQDTITNNLVNDIFDNITSSNLTEFFPTPPDSVNNTLLGINGKSNSFCIILLFPLCLTVR